MDDLVGQIDDDGCIPIKRENVQRWLDEWLAADGNFLYLGCKPLEGGRSDWEVRVVRENNSSFNLSAFEAKSGEIYCATNEKADGDGYLATDEGMIPKRFFVDALTVKAVISAFVEDGIMQPTQTWALEEEYADHFE